MPPRTVSIEFRGATVRRRVETGALLEVTLAGQPVDTEALPKPRDDAGYALAGSPPGRRPVDGTAREPVRSRSSPGGIILLIAIAVGNEMGNRVLGQATERGPAILATPVATPVGADPDPGDVNWRRSQVVSVATDPAFPDPRVTPPPPPPPADRRATSRPPPPRPRARVPAASRAPYTSPAAADPARHATRPTKGRRSRRPRRRPRPHRLAVTPLTCHHCPYFSGGDMIETMGELR